MILFSPVRKSILVAVVLTSWLPGCCFKSDEAITTSNQVLRLAVATSTHDTGLLDELVPIFERSHGARIDVIAVGTGAALKLGEAGDVDVVLVHGREAEDAFMAAGHGVRREDVMYNTFEILGPEGDPAGVSKTAPSEALRKIADRRACFVSRGDNSGTHQRELALWHAAGGLPDWDGYVESGQGMGTTLTMADQMKAYVLTDRGTYLKFKNKIELVPVVISPTALYNPYSILVVDPTKRPDMRGELAQAFADFMISAVPQQLIRDYRIDGEPLFHSLRLSEQH